jgi:hypothetical protein
MEDIYFGIAGFLLIGVTVECFSGGLKDLLPDLSKTTKLILGCTLALAWIVMSLSLLNRIKTGEYPLAILKIIGVDSITYHIGDLGMDDIGRQVWCQTLDGDAKSEYTDVRVYCEDRFRRTMVISMKTAAPIMFGRITPDDIILQMKNSYSIALEGLGGVILRGDKETKKVEARMPMGEVKDRLEKLGVKNIADFYAACGFAKLLVRDEEEKSIYLELHFSDKSYGKNPVLVKK